jgi:phenylacetyl-CoA:acceptor oxidoreductase subunit 2
MNSALKYGPKPWPQSFWDARAAANFVCGGMGAGLVVATALSGTEGPGFAVPMLLGLAIVACGLLAVFAEVGRPLRAANVVLNPRTSWMAREALVAPVLFACGLVAVFGSAAFAWPAALAALAFAACQGRMVHASRGIPAWRAPQVPWLLPLTGLAEGLGVWLIVAAFTHARAPLVAELLALAVVARLLLYRVYRHALGATIVAPAAQALDTAGRVLFHVGTLAVLALLAAAFALSAAEGSRWLLAAAGLAAVVPGAWLKATLILRAGHTQGYTLPQLPVRGTRA